jgi:hypothetical protein
MLFPHPDQERVTDVGIGSPSRNPQGEGWLHPGADGGILPG